MNHNEAMFVNLALDTILFLHQVSQIIANILAREVLDDKADVKTCEETTRKCISLDMKESATCKIFAPGIFDFVYYFSFPYTKASNYNCMSAFLMQFQQKIHILI
jgi:hypothetical protein